MIQCREALCISDRENNEDLVRVTQEYALVMDGSTNLGMYENMPDARWYVQAFARAFDACFHKGDPRTAAGAAMEQLRQEYLALTGRDPAVETAVPSASFSLVYEAAGEVVIALLGDCTAVVYPKVGQPYALYQDGVEKVDGRARQEMCLLSRRQGITVAQAAQHPQIRQLLQENRSRMNTPEGYWILSFCREALEHMQITRLPAQQVAAVTLFSDGFDRMKPVFLQGLPNRSLQQLYRQIYEEEEKDPDFTRFPRFKCHDDASCVLLEIGE